MVKNAPELWSKYLCCLDRVQCYISVSAIEGILFFFPYRAEYTKQIVKPSLGERGVGGAMAVYGVFDAIVSSKFWYDNN